jgi:hypothetical protein
VRGPHWTLLGIAPTADVREIKRAYARLLKQTRPDDDPEGFQRLREALEAALAQAPRVRPEGVTVSPVPASIEPVLVEHAFPAGPFPSAASAPSSASLRPQLLRALREGASEAAVQLLDAALAAGDIDERMAMGDWLLDLCCNDSSVPPSFFQAAQERFAWLDEEPHTSGRQRRLARLAQRRGQIRAQEVLAPLLAQLDRGDEDEALKLLQEALDSQQLEALDARENFECFLMRYLVRTGYRHNRVLRATFRACKWRYENRHLQQFDQGAWRALDLWREGEDWYADLRATWRKPDKHKTLEQRLGESCLFLRPHDVRLRWRMINMTYQLGAHVLVQEIDSRYGWLAPRFDPVTLAWLRQPRAHLGRFPFLYLLLLALPTAVSCAYLPDALGLLVSAPDKFQCWLLLWPLLVTAIIWWLPRYSPAAGYRMATGILLSAMASVLFLLTLAAVNTTPEPHPPLWLLALPALLLTAIVMGFAWLQRRWPLK